MVFSSHKFWITLAAVVGYGAWAFYSSVYDGTMEQHFNVAVRAGAIQGAYAGLLTLINLSVLEFLFLKFNSWLPCLANIIVTVLSATVAQYLIIVPVHLLNGTPNIALTLAPGIVIGTAFSTVYLFSVKKKFYPVSSTSNVQVTYFQRKRRESAFSLESIFSDIRERLSDRIDSKVCVAPFYSNGIFRRLAILIHAKFREGEINHITGDNNYAGLLLKKSRTVLTIHDCADYEERVGIRGWLLRRVWINWPISRCSIVTTISEASRQTILRISDCSPDKVVIIPVGISESFSYREKSEIRMHPRILQVGTSINKNLERVVQALEGLSCTLIVVGQLSNEQRRHLDLSEVDYENLFGISTTELVREYEKCDMLVFVSLYEGFGMPIIEAQTVGRPVVTSNISSMPEVAGAGACLVDPASISSIRLGIERVLTDVDYRNALVSKGRLNSGRFDASKIAEQYFSVYRSICD